MHHGEDSNDPGSHDNGKDGGDDREDNDNGKDECGSDNGGDGSNNGDRSNNGHGNDDGHGSDSRNCHEGKGGDAVAVDDKGASNRYIATTISLSWANHGSQYHPLRVQR